MWQASLAVILIIAATANIVRKRSGRAKAMRSAVIPGAALVLGVLVLSGIAGAAFLSYFGALPLSGWDVSFFGYFVAGTALPRFAVPLAASAAILYAWPPSWRVALGAVAAGLVAGRLVEGALGLRYWATSGAMNEFELGMLAEVVFTPWIYDAFLLAAVLSFVSVARLVPVRSAGGRLSIAGLAPLPGGQKEGRCMRIGHSQNEPRRLLVSAARVGRYPQVRTLLQEAKDPCRARALSLGLDDSEVVAAAEACRKERLRDAFAYTGIGLAGSALAPLTPVAPLLSIVVACAVFLRRRWRYKYRIAREFSSTLDAKNPAGTDPAALVDGRNLVVFSGYGPFASFGLSIYNINLSTDVTRASEDGAREGGEPDAPNVDVLERRILASLAGSSIVNGEATELFFAQGVNLPDELRSGGPHRPPDRIEPSLGRVAAAASDSRLRRYLWMRQAVWNGEMLVSYFLRMVRVGGDLTLELHGLFASPVADSYRWIDKLPKRSWRTDLSDVYVGLLAGLVLPALAPFYLAYRLIAAVFDFMGLERRALLRAVQSDPTHDLGAPTSLRARTASGKELYFQLMDRAGIEQAFAGRILREYIDYLSECGIDTTELRERRSMILNQGVIVQGGQLNATNLAAGSGATIGAGPGGPGRSSRKEAA